MSHNTWDYAAELRACGYRVTPQRRAVMDAVCAGGGQSTLAGILERVRTQDAAINPATVYRSLDFLVDQGLIAKAELHHGEAVYAIAGPAPHHHLICRACRREIVIDVEPIEQLRAVLCERYGFELDARHLMLVGLCAECRDKT